jgi:hypothetical protein
VKFVLAFVVTIGSLAAHAAVSGQEISGFELATGSEDFQLKARAAKAWIASVDEIVAAEEVDVVVKDGARETRAHCRSFSHNLKHGLAICEGESSIAIDTRARKVTYYSAK